MLAVTCDVILLPIFIASLCSRSFFLCYFFFFGSGDKVNTHSHTALNFILLATRGAKKLAFFRGGNQYLALHNLVGKAEGRRRRKTKKKRKFPLLIFRLQHS
jgi:hypothetical protein